MKWAVVTQVYWRVTHTCFRGWGRPLQHPWTSHTRDPEPTAFSRCATWLLGRTAECKGVSLQWPHHTACPLPCVRCAVKVPSSSALPFAHSLGARRLGVSIPARALPGEGD